MNQKYKIFIYSFASILALFFLTIIIFFLYLQPILKQHIAVKAARYGFAINADKIGIDGVISLGSQKFSLNNNADIFIQKAEIRPPLPFFSGFAFIKNFKIVNSNYTINLPILKINGIKKNKTAFAKNNKLYKYNFANIYIPTAFISLPNNDYIELTDIYLNNIKNGNIRSVTVDAIKLNLNQIAGKLTKTEITNINFKNILDSWKKANFLTEKKLWQNIAIDNFLLNIHNNIIINSAKLNIGSLLINPSTSSLKYILQQITLDKNNIEQLQEDSLNLIKIIKRFGINLGDTTIKTPKIKIKLNQANINADNWQNLIPYKIDATFKNLSFTNLIQNLSAIPETWQYLNFDGKINFDYNPLEQIFVLNNFDYNINNLSKTTLSGTASGVPSKLFNIYENIPENLCDKISLHSLKLFYSDNNFINSLIKWLSKNENVDEDDMKFLIYTILEKSPALIIHNKPLGDLVGQKLLETAQKPQSYTISVKAKNSNGVKLNEIINDNIKNLDNLTQKINLHIVNKAL